MQNPSDKTTLLMLNDYCLMEIFQYLELTEYVNLHKTCHRLRDICDMVCSLKYKKIVVDTRNYNKGSNKKVSKTEFSDVMSVIGRHVLEVEIGQARQVILDTIVETCKNLKSLKMWRSKRALNLQKFKNLKEFRMVSCSKRARMNIDEWRSFIRNNPDLESLECIECGQDKFMELMKMLPTLKTLSYLNLATETFRLTPAFHNLLNLDGLTKFTFFSTMNCNKLLIELAKRSNLVELNVVMDFNAESLQIIKSFRDLEMLSISNYEHVNFQAEWFSGASVFSPKLKRIKVDSIEIACTTFFSILKELKFLEEFDLCGSEAFLDGDRSIRLTDLNLMTRIAAVLQMESNRPTLKIIGYYLQPVLSHYIFKSHHLQIINGEFAKVQAESRRIIVDCSNSDSSFSRASNCS